jgi:hypothetical protein
VLLPVALLALGSAVVYANTLRNDWHLDDF